MSEAAATPKRKSSVFWAILVSAPLAGLAMSQLFLLFGSAFDGVDTSAPSASPDIMVVVLGAIYGAIVGALIGWPASLVIGLPMHKIMLSRGWVTLVHYMLGGSVCGIPPILLVVMFAAMADNSVENLTPLIYSAGFVLVAGAIAGSIFWLIRRPDRDPRPTLSPEVAHV